MTEFVDGFSGNFLGTFALVSGDRFVVNDGDCRFVWPSAPMTDKSCANVKS